MSTSPNSLSKKPKYTAHRRDRDAIDAANLSTLWTTQLKERGAIDASGFDSLHGFVIISGGGSVTLKLLELVDYVDESGDAQQKLVERGSAIGPIATDITFSFDTPGGGKWFLRIDVLSAGTVQVYLAGGLRANEGSI